METYDLIVLGGGPAGLAAGMYGARARMKTAIIEKGRPGGQAATTEDLENYPGFGPGTTGPGLTQSMADHALAFGAELIKDNIVELFLEESPKKIVCKKETYLARAVIYALGAEPRLLNVSGEGRLRGKGVSYCATCDADLFEELDVVVVGSGDAAIEEAEYLTKFAENVTVIVIHEEGKVDANRVAAERAFKNPKLKWIWNSTVKSINGSELVENVTLKNIKTGAESDYPTNGVFIFIGTLPNSDLLQGRVELNKQGYIITDYKMATNIEGVFAAGDVCDKYLRQVVTAAADGAIAAVAAEKYVHETQLWQSEVLNSEKPVLVAYYDPTDMTGTEKIGLVDQFVSRHQEKLALVKVDATRNELVERRYHIDLNRLPMVQLFKKGELINSIYEISSVNLSRLTGVN
ncbi:Thioredoxin reductase [Syntrophomonas zehnderi OL-4]|uniref:Thioredoxin reductase n=1 Tax=Syntrophomonas zehnderi OL-4 TaxID=690567 RepID=A0A0E4GEQ4_9FIRM|nr:thioredoxin-disulfide reductase [Syntrophomonas zehnderi]CFX93907.1 Thioredoxin reductase [Syntrophomonas zehnderi OL-4]